MAFSPSQSQDATAVLSFVSQHKTQIRQKATAHAGIDYQDYQQEVLLFILEAGHKFDPSRGSFESFVFGFVEKRLRRVLDDALSRARSIDDDSEHGRSFRERVEALHYLVCLSVSRSLIWPLREKAMVFARRRTFSER